MLTRDDAQQRDDVDPLACWRSEFLVADESLVYLDGNSLGMAPRRTLARLTELIGEEWAGGLVRSWDHWIDLPRAVGARLAPLIGAAADEVIVHDSTTVNLHQLVAAACGLRPERTVISVGADDFPTDRYVAAGVAAARGMTVRAGHDRLDDVAVVVRSLVDYRTGALADLDAETERVRRSGALLVWDLSHAVGAVEVDLGSAGADFAVGCTYKYLNGGPGSPAFSFVRAELQPLVHQPIWGWFAQTDQFAMGPRFTPQLDMRRLLLGTPSVLALAAAEQGIAVTAEAGIAAIAAKGRALTSFALELCDQFGLQSPTPRDPRRRGAHIAVSDPHARKLVSMLSDHGVIADYREPDIVRIGCSPLTTRFVDVYDGLSRLAGLKPHS
jgi:kynureninase